MPTRRPANPAPVVSTTPVDTVPVSMLVNDTDLDFWIRRNYQKEILQLMVKKHTDQRPLGTCECYPIATITRDGEMYRNSGLPTDWGFRLTTDRRIKEIR